MGYDAVVVEPHLHNATREQIFRMIYRGEVALLLGGDVPLYDGMTTQPEIARCLAEKCSYPSSLPRGLHEIGQYYAELFDLPELIAHVVELVRPAGGSSLLELISRATRIGDIFTTCVDESIQGFFPPTDLHVVRTDEDVALALRYPRRLYRLNGALHHPPNLILTKDHLTQRLSKGLHSPVLVHLAYNLTSRLFLIIGHDLREWDFAYYVKLVTQMLGEFRHKAVVLAGGTVDPVLAAYWAKCNVQIVSEDPIAFFQRYLEWEQQQ